MKRRKALALTMSIMGATIIGSELFLTGCTNKHEKSNLFTDSDIDLLDEVGEVILPETHLSPGAKEAKIGLFMKSIVTDCYNQQEQNIFKKGITELNRISKNNYSSKFVRLRPEQKLNILIKLDHVSRENADKEPDHFFSMMKQLTIWGYFTSEPGATKALRYNPIPGQFKGCIPYHKGDKAWA